MLSDINNLVIKCACKQVLLCLGSRTAVRRYSDLYDETVTTVSHKYNRAQAGVWFA